MNDLRAAIDLHTSLTVTQAERLLGRAITPVDVRAAGLRQYELVAQPVAQSSRMMVAEVISRTVLVRTTNESRIRHQIGTAELFLQLRAAGDGTWEPEQSSEFQHEKPDATWTRSTETVAAEFDAGGYSTSQIKKKLQAYGPYQGYARVVWGVAEERTDGRSTRIRNRQRIAAGLGVNVDVIPIVWWA